MNLSALSALPTFRFASLKPAATRPIFGALAPAPSDVFFAKTISFGHINKPIDYPNPNNPGLQWQSKDLTHTLYKGESSVGKVTFESEAAAKNVEVTPVLSKGGVALRIKPKGQDFSLTVTPGGKVDAFGLHAELVGEAPSIPTVKEADAALKLLTDKAAFLRPKPSNAKPEEHKVIILASGGGTRLKELTGDMPKPLFPLANGKSMLRNLIEQLISDGFRPENIAITIPPAQQSAFASDLEGTGVNRFFVQPKANGTADAINQFATDKQQKQWLDLKNGKAVVVLGADHIDNLNMAQLLEAHVTNGADFTVGTYKLPKSEIMGTYGLVKTKGGQVQSGPIETFVEKPQTGSKAEALVDENGDAAGVFKQVLNANLFQKIETYCNYIIKTNEAILSFNTIINGVNKLITTINKPLAKFNASIPLFKEIPPIEMDLNNGVTDPFIAKGGKGWNELYDPEEGYAWTDAGKVSELAAKNYTYLLGGKISPQTTEDAHKHMDANGVFYQNTQWREQLENKVSGPVWVLNNN